MSGDPDPSGAEAQGALEGADAPEAEPAKAIEKFNPSPVYSYYEAQTGQPMAVAVTEYLMGHGEGVTSAQQPRPHPLGAAAIGGRGR